MALIIESDDLIIETYPPRNKGGQHVGVEYGVKITHQPTGLIAICNSGRSQFTNREIAMHMIESAITHPKFR